MSRENVEIVRGLLDALIGGDYETGLAALDPDVEFDMSIRPDGGVARGHEGVVDAGDQVLAVHRESGRGKGSGVPLSQTTFCVYTLRDRKVVRVEAFHTREVALEAAGLSE